VLGFISCVCVFVWATNRFKTCEVNDGLMQNEKPELFVNVTLPLRWPTLKEESCVQRHTRTCTINVLFRRLYNTDMSSRGLKNNWQHSDFAFVSALFMYGQRQSPAPSSILCLMSTC
jgi:hypothetical protein